MKSSPTAAERSPSQSKTRRNQLKSKSVEVICRPRVQLPVSSPCQSPPKQKFPKTIEIQQVQFMPFSHTKGGCASAVQKTVELSLVQHIERIVEVTVVITAPNTKPAAVAVHRQVVEIIDIPLVTQTVSTNRKIQLRRHRRWDPSRWVRRYGTNSP